MTGSHSTREASQGRPERGEVEVEDGKGSLRVGAHQEDKEGVQLKCPTMSDGTSTSLGEQQRKEGF